MLLLYKVFFSLMFSVWFVMLTTWIFIYPDILNEESNIYLIVSAYIMTFIFGGMVYYLYKYLKRRSAK